MKNLMIVAAMTMIPLTVALADDACLYGSAKWASGSKIDGSTRISTSYNGKEAFPRSGEYRLCFGSNPKSRITVYIDSRTYTEVVVNGNTRLDIVRSK